MKMLAVRNFFSTSHLYFFTADLTTCVGLFIFIQESQLVGGWPVGYLQRVEELNSGPPKTNPSSGREEDLNPGSPDYKFSALPLGHARLPKLIKK